MPFLIYFSLYLVTVGKFDLKEHAFIKITILFFYIFCFETVYEDEKSNFKRLKMLSETKCAKSFSNNVSKRYEVFLLEPFIYCT